jgi:hypothetical protein
MSPVKYGLGFHIAEDAILRSDRREHLKPYMCDLFLPTASVSPPHSLSVICSRFSTHPDTRRQTF